MTQNFVGLALSIITRGREVDKMIVKIRIGIMSLKMEIKSPIFKKRIK